MTYPYLQGVAGGHIPDLGNLPPNGFFNNH
jgi:hypothetical protein